MSVHEEPVTVKVTTVLKAIAFLIVAFVIFTMGIGWGESGVQGAMKHEQMIISKFQKAHPATTVPTDIGTATTQLKDPAQPQG